MIVAIRKLLGESIVIIDTSEAVVKQLKRQLEAKAVPDSKHDKQQLTFISSKDEQSLLAMANELMYSDMHSHHIQAKFLGNIS